jgi:hypothetical protein
MNDFSALRPHGFHFEGPSQHLAPAVNAVYVWCEVGVKPPQQQQHPPHQPPSQPHLLLPLSFTTRVPPFSPLPPNSPAPLPPHRQPFPTTPTLPRLPGPHHPLQRPLRSQLSPLHHTNPTHPYPHAHHPRLPMPAFSFASSLMVSALASPDSFYSLLYGDAAAPRSSSLPSLLPDSLLAASDGRPLHPHPRQSLSYSPRPRLHTHRLHEAHLPFPPPLLLPIPPTRLCLGLGCTRRERGRKRGTLHEAPPPFCQPCPRPRPRRRCPRPCPAHNPRPLPSTRPRLGLCHTHRERERKRGTLDESSASPYRQLCPRPCPRRRCPRPRQHHPRSHLLFPCPGPCHRQIMLQVRRKGRPSTH